MPVKPNPSTETIAVRVPSTALPAPFSSLPCWPFPCGDKPPAAGADEERLEKILTLIRTSAGRLVLGNPEFVKQFLRQLYGEARAEAIAAFVENAYSLGSVGFAGDPNQRIEQNRRAIETVLLVLQSDGDMDDLIATLNSREMLRYDFGGHFGPQLPDGQELSYRANYPAHYFAAVKPISRGGLIAIAINIVRY